jgi:outer membrane protein OmpA-like peptidoglycan-associated protein
LRTARVREVLSAVIAVFGMLRVAHAEPLLVSVEGQGAIALTTPQSDLFGPGVNFAVAVRYPLGPMLQLGAEVRAGLLSAGAEPIESGLEQPGVGSFELGMLMLRLKPLATIDGTSPRRAAGLFVDVGAGGGVTGKQGRVGFQGGLGYGVGLGGGFTLAPTVRYLQVVQPSDALSSRDARLLLFGLELSAFDARARVHHPLPEPVVVAEPPPPEPAPPPPPPAAVVVEEPHDECPVGGCPDPNSDRDHDHIIDSYDKCPDEPETVNGQDDDDGCPDEGEIVLENDRIVLDEHVLFDKGMSRVKHAGWSALAAIVKLKKQHPEWIKIRIEGHADASGPTKLNQELSERRARNAGKHLIGIGVPPEQIETVGFGSTRPRDQGSSDEAKQRNRRVEFVVVRGEAAETPQADEPQAEAPRVDAPRVETPKAVTPKRERPKREPSKHETSKHEVKPEPAKRAQIVLPEVYVSQPAPPPKPHEPVPAKPKPQPAPSNSGLTPSGLTPLPAEKKE